jgi:hypothetical protein
MEGQLARRAEFQPKITSSPRVTQEIIDEAAHRILQDSQPSWTGWRLLLNKNYTLTAI